MSSFHSLLLASLLLASAAAQAQPNKYPGVGRAATDIEVAAWDIDVRPDFKGLPKGQGSVAKGMEVWEGKCSSCHGIFGESNEVFAPITGGTRAEDIKSGRAARLLDGSFPSRTTMMKLSSLSTLWDYINRAMPWTAPKSLTTEEVYAVTAYILNLGGVLPDSFTLSNENMAEVQTAPAQPQWHDARACAVAGRPVGQTPSRRARHRLHEGLQRPCRRWPRSCPTSRATPMAIWPSRTARSARSMAPTRPSRLPRRRRLRLTRSRWQRRHRWLHQPRRAADGAAAAIALTKKHGCVACHGIDNKILGPSFRDVAKKYAGRADAVGLLASKIKAGGSGVWGAMPMPPQALGEADAKVIAQWLADGAEMSLRNAQVMT